MQAIGAAQMTKHDFLFGGVGIGTFPFASPFTPVSHADKIAILDEYFRRGGKYIDTAPTYGLGAVENFLGDALTGRPRDSFAISTSCGYVIDPVTSAVTVSGRRDDIIADLEASLRRLKVDFIDV
jgi:D-threo-aldose 1-dehydrogenase